MTCQTDDPHNFFHLLLDALIKQGRLTMPAHTWDVRLKRLENGGSITCDERKILLDIAKELMPQM
jgi:hypothetical protein